MIQNAGGDVNSTNEREYRTAKKTINDNIK